MASGFFNTIPKITHFKGVVEEQNFYPAPNDWLIVIADICSSTEAIAAGRYKEVNLIGGAIICAIQNATGTRDWPFVFGGDGATVLIHPDVKISVQTALLKTRSMAKREFDLDLRIGIVPIADMRKRGADVLVARHEVSPGNCLALFGGGGVELAEKLVKSTLTGGPYTVPERVELERPDLTGLSCRWEFVKNQNGKILCLLIKPRADNFRQRQQAISRFLSKLGDVIGSEFNDANPVTEKTMQLRWPPKGLAAEIKITRTDKPHAKHVVQLYLKSLFQWCLNRFDLTAAAYDAPKYRNEIIQNSDYCKFDDALKMVLDCKITQIEQIKSILAQMRLDGDLDFGLFETDRALMTCLLFDLDSGQHLHFIDGDNGGLYRAARELKMQRD